jgi:rhamnose utilization protein RhaD (predicted bifunctional aldolase and dehydrogenase)
VAVGVSTRRNTLGALVKLSRDLGAPQNDYAILAEGNTSAQVSDGSFLLKASGLSLSSVDAGSFVEMRTAAVLELLDAPSLSDEQLTLALSACRVGDGARPSTEAPLHALALTLGRASFVGHTHPTAVNSILCSKNAAVLSEGVLFPDQVVVCGRHPLFIPYVDPGVPLAFELRVRLRKHLDAHGTPPRVIYLENHGLIALGRTPNEVLHVTAMATKTARIMLGALAAGGPNYLGKHDAIRIETRPDERYRQHLLSSEGGAEGDDDHRHPRA